MGKAADKLHRGARRVLLSQAIILVLIAGVWLSLQGYFAAFSAAYGGVIALLSTWWLARTIRSATTLVSANPPGGMLTLYSGVAQRLIFSVTALAIGMGLLKLLPLPVLIGFGLTHVGVLFAGGRSASSRS